MPAEIPRPTQSSSSAALGLAPAPWNWTRGELLTDLYGKGVLALATSGAYILLDNAI